MKFNECIKDCVKDNEEQEKSSSTKVHVIDASDSLVKYARKHMKDELDKYYSENA